MTHRLWLLEAVGNLLLLAMVYIWLGIGDARIGQLISTFVLGALIIFIALWLYASLFAYFATPYPDLKTLFRETVPRLPAFAALVLLFLAAWWACHGLQSPIARAAQWTASVLTFHSRKPFRPATVAFLYASALWCIQWVVVPVAFLPFAVSVAQGWRGTELAKIRLRAPRFWFEYLLAITAGFYLPYRLIHYPPALHGTAAEVISFLVRFSLAYFLLVTGWFALAFFSSGGRPRATQPSTAVSP